MLKRTVFTVLLLLSAGAFAGDFPRPESLEPAVQFWTRVYTEVSTAQGFIHDDEFLGVVYATLDLPPRGNDAARSRVIDRAKADTVQALTTLGKGKRNNLTAIESRVLSAWPPGTTGETFRRAAQRVRFQLGQSDRFRAGLVRSGQWKPYIREVLAARGLPPELEVLPHVESSFNPAAWSRVAAAGMWQFMPGTARQYMRVDHIVDERLDPFVATEGAARLLKSNYMATGTWPLALTSYNHGTGGVLRAARSVGSNDIGVIVARYRGRGFGFASRNFYASFLAALDIDRNPGRYFGTVRIDAPEDLDAVPLADFLPARAVADATGLGLEELRRFNPALREPVWKGEKFIPRGYTLRLPRARLQQPLVNYVASIPASRRSAHQQPDLMHRIAPGESLWVIARRYGTTTATLKSLNNLGSNNIRAGRTLILPGTTMAEASQTGIGKTSVAASMPPGEYVIRKGDSLWSIARRLNVSQQQLVALNEISVKKHLQPGQRLKVPASNRS